MPAQLIDGKKIANHLQEKLKQQLQQSQQQGFPIPGLAVILVGENSASEIYIRNKRLACEKVGIASDYYPLPHSTTQEALLDLIIKLNAAKNIHGILVQLPLPSHIDTNIVMEAISPAKDVDGFHPYNIGRLAQKRPLMRSCTPYGVIKLLEAIDLSLEGLHSVIVGASNIVGKPMALELLSAGCTITVCHSKTSDLAKHIREADLLVAAIGCPGVIKTDWIKPGAIVIDVGINRQDNGLIVGDIDFASAKQRAAWITPVPGGVGPMTVTMLLYNTYRAAQLAFHSTYKGVP